MLASSQGGGALAPSHRGGGLFTHRLLEALEAQDAGAGPLGARDWFARAEAAVVTEAALLSRSQRPRFHAGPDGFSLELVAEPGAE